MRRALATGMWVLTLAEVAAWAGLYATGPGRIYPYWGEEISTGVAFATLGFLIVRRQHSNALGWIFLASGVAAPFGLVAGQAAIVTSSGGLGALAEATRISSFIALGFLLLLYPTGRPPSRAWNVCIWLLLVGLVGVAIWSALGPIEDVPDIASRVPPVLATVRQIAGFANPLAIIGVLVAVASLVYRYVRAKGLERLQVKFFALTSVTIALAIIAANVLLGRLMEGAFGSLLWGSPGVLLPAAATYAILRHGLFDIERFVSRTLSYGIVSAVLVGIYVVIAAAVPAALFGERDTPDVAIAAGTLAAAGAFRPVRRAVQSRVDRRFNRSRYDAERTVDAFAATLRRQVDLDTLAVELEGIVDRTVHPAHLSLWLKR